MPKQTRLNFSKQSTTAFRRRKRNSDDETDEQNERPPQRLKTTGPSNGPLENAEADELPPAQKSRRTTKKPSPEVESSPSRPINQSKTTPHISLTYQKASLFDSPASSLLCHATNAQGSWGAGIAAAFKKNYPAAFKLYAAHCSKWNGSSLLGTTLLIPPQQKTPLKAEREARHWIACLFTSEKKGKGKGSKESILAATGEAIEDLVRKVKDVNETGDDKAKSKSGSGDEDRIAEVRMCKINSGLFGVPWEATSEVIEAVEIGEGDVEEIAVYSMD